MSHERKPIIPPLDGSFILPKILDFHCEYNADLPMYAFAEEGKNEPTLLSFLEFGRASHRVSHILRPNCAGPDNQVVGIIANTDTILYQALVAGLVKAGLVVSFFRCLVLPIWRQLFHLFVLFSRSGCPHGTPPQQS